jgi:hypothetical protein
MDPEIQASHSHCRWGRQNNWIWPLPERGGLSPGLDLETLLELGHQGKREGVPLYPPWGGLFDL